MCAFLVYFLLEVKKKEERERRVREREEQRREERGCLLFPIQILLDHCSLDSIRCVVYCEFLPIREFPTGLPFQDRFTCET